MLGLTGGIGSGKSAAAEAFAQLGIETIDADHAARWVVEPGDLLSTDCRSLWRAMLLDDGQLNRPHWRAYFFAEPEQRHA